MAKAPRTPDPAANEAHGSVSKSERKRQAHRLQTLGRQLTELKSHQLAELPLPDNVLTAITDYQRFPSHGARRRQLQFIGRLMRDVDVAPVQAALDTLQGHSAQAQYEFHQLERWRERLVAEPDALTEFLSAFPHADVQQLRHRIQQVQKSTTESQQRTALRALFRLLRDSLHPV